MKKPSRLKKKVHFNLVPQIKFLPSKHDENYQRQLIAMHTPYRRKFTFLDPALVAEYENELATRSEYERRRENLIIASQTYINQGALEGFNAFINDIRNKENNSTGDDNLICSLYRQLSEQTKDIILASALAPSIRQFALAHATEHLCMSLDQDCYQSVYDEPCCPATIATTALQEAQEHIGIKLAARMHSTGLIPNSDHKKFVLPSQNQQNRTPRFCIHQHQIIFLMILNLFCLACFARQCCKHQVRTLAQCKIMLKNTRSARAALIGLLLSFSLLNVVAAYTAFSE